MGNGKEVIPRKLKVLDLFSGIIGGFSLGLERTGGFETVGLCELKPHAQAVLAKNFPGVPCHGDVTTYPFQEGEADVITAGFPCQDISFAGDGAGLAGARSGLYREVVRALRVVRPLWAVLENVSALLSRGLGTVLGDMASVGYDAEWHCIPASAVGAPHRRDRIWIIAHPRGEQYEGSRAPLSGSLAAQLLEIMANAEGERRSEARQLRYDESEEWFAGSGEAVADAAGIRWEKWHSVCGWSGEGGCEEQGPGLASRCWWAIEPDVGRVAHGVPKELDGANGQAVQEYDPQASPQGDGGRHSMPGLRRDGEIGAPSSGLYEAGCGRGSLPAVPREGGPAGWNARREGHEGVHDLRAGVPPNAQQETHDLQPGVQSRSWPAERPEALGSIWSVEPDVPRVAHGVPNRVDRLEELGNAVVPQIPELIGNAILESMRTAA